jgi:hypothetical protein
MELDTQESTLERKFDLALVAQINDTLKQAATSRRPHAMILENDGLGEDIAFSPNSAPISAGPPNK